MNVKPQTAPLMPFGLQKCTVQTKKDDFCFALGGQAFGHVSAAQVFEYDHDWRPWPAAGAIAIAMMLGIPAHT